MYGAAHCGQVLSCGSVKTLLYARRMRCRLLDGFRFGTPINLISICQNFSLFNSFHAGEPSSGDPILLKVLDLPMDAFRNPPQLVLHNGCCGNSRRISSRTAGVKSTQSLITCTASSPCSGRWQVQGSS